MEVLKFKERGEKAFDLARASTRPTKKALSRPCASPIVIDRWEKSTVCLSFRTDCFTLAFLENALKCLGYGEESIWKLRVLDDPMRGHVSYLLILQKDFKEKTSSMLTTVVDRIIKEAYLAEIRAWGNDVKLHNLVMPYQYKLEDGAQISSKTKDLLGSKGVQNAWDLIDLPREELCKMPNMTTREVYKLEKSLAVRGIFLRNQIPSLI